MTEKENGMAIEQKRTKRHVMAGFVAGGLILLVAGGLIGFGVLIANVGVGIFGG